ncbi:MAG: PfkB family carbohydrate kinase [Solirubrobacteraceae bacterium]|nr:PfkB family carbohydrate kinase [Solirubrobacteraceae bacterium]
MPGAPAVTVLANLAVDRIDGAPPSPGGCASFASAALELFGAGRVVTRAAPADLPLFDAVLGGVDGVVVDLLPARVTSAFGLAYDGDDRVMTVDAIGPVWTPVDIARAAVRTPWVHVSPLLRSDFPADSLATLADGGHRVALDGQGLVRLAAVGPMQVDAAFDPAVLAHLSVLKLADDEATVLTGGRPFVERDARGLGIPEILITNGSRGCDLYLGGVAHHVPPAWRVRGVQATGAGDMFTVAYVAARARGDDAFEAASVASRLVAELLQVRLEAQG